MCAIDAYKRLIACINVCDQLHTCVVCVDLCACDRMHYIEKPAYCFKLFSGLRCVSLGTELTVSLVLTRGICFKSSVRQD